MGVARRRHFSFLVPLTQSGETIMAGKKQNEHAAEVVDDGRNREKNGAAAPEFKEAAPIQGFDLAAKMSVWSPKTTKTAIKGILIGLMDLPSPFENQDRWWVYVIELTAPAQVSDSEDDVKTMRVAEAGEKVLVTQTAVLKRIEPAALDRARVFEVYLKPGKQQANKAGTGKVQLFESMTVGRSFQRTSKYNLPSMSRGPLALPPASAEPFPDQDDARGDGDIPF